MGLDSRDVGSDTQQPCSFDRSVLGRHVLQELLDQAVPEGEHPADSIQGDGGVFAHQPHSEEEYEEDIIEPRTLNEITTLTDRTSPWSSVLSVELGADQQPTDMEPEGQHLVDIDCLRKGSSRRSSTLSSTPQGDNRSLLTSLSSCISPHMLQSSPWTGAEGFKSLSNGTETADREPVQPACLSELHQTVSSLVENGNYVWDRTLNTKQVEQQHTEFHAASKELLEFPEDISLTAPKATAREEESCEVLNEDHQVEEKSDSDEVCANSVSAQAGLERHSGSLSDGSHKDPLEESGKSEKPKMVLSDPVVVPNFFLPPQQMEASMRMLSSSSHPPTSSHRAALGSIPYRRLPQRPALDPAELSKEETRRIARIFSARLCGKE
ncbi:C2 domain-containing protein 3-like isoform X2 [Coturnix japonica]|uniref:C2 domain-containing protein 3-like isoform X2 n=1 Tax=Coturnix japonica TaxID=93934 RepID=UPI000776FC78|nr:C2 domain-containing protein 3-like isoform X2 [Coturnix japonica]